MVGQSRFVPGHRNFRTYLGKREPTFSKHCSTRHDDERHAEHRYRHGEPRQPVAGGMIQGDRKACNHETRHCEEIEKHGALREFGASLETSELILLVRLAARFGKLPDPIDDARKSNECRRGERSRG